MGLGRYAMGWALYEQLTPRRPSGSDEAFEFGLDAMIAGLALRVPAATQGRGERLRPA
jgi:hypothetical protein